MVIAATPATPTTAGTSRPVPPPLPPSMSVAAGVARAAPPRPAPPASSSQPALTASAGDSRLGPPPLPEPPGPPAIPARPALHELHDPGTDPLADWRQRRTRRVLVSGGVALAIIAVVLVATRGGADEAPAVARAPAAAADVPVDAGVPVDATLPPDASREAIIAENRYGYLTITAPSKFTVFIDKQRVVNDAFDQYPLRPGPYKIKVVGPRGRVERFDVIIEATKTTTKRFDW
jgi:hypothetical protein